MGLNGMPSHRHPFAEKRIARNVSQQGIGADLSAAMDLCEPLDTFRHQRSSGAAKLPGRQAMTALLA